MLFQFPVYITIKVLLKENFKFHKLFPDSEKKIWSFYVISPLKTMSSLESHDSTQHRMGFISYQTYSFVIMFRYFSVFRVFIVPEREEDISFAEQFLD